MKKGQKSITAILFYVFAVLFLAYTAYSIFTAYEYVADYIEAGTITYANDFEDILALYVQQAGPYLVYSLLLYGIGYLIDQAAKIKEVLELGNVSRPVEMDDSAFLASIKSTPAKKEKTVNKEIAAKPEKKEEAKKEVITEDVIKEEVKVEEVKAEEVKKEVKPKAEKTTKATKKPAKKETTGKKETAAKATKETEKVKEKA